MLFDIEEQYDKIYRYCYFRLHNRELAEDVTQETFLRYLKNYQCTTTASALKYMYTIARNLCVDEYRKLKTESLDEAIQEHAIEENLITNSVAIGVATLMTLIVIGLSLGVYGAEGFKMPIQSCLLSYSYPITIGQACLIAYGVLIIASILAAVFVMVISEMFRSGIVALAISTGLIILGNVIMIPTQYRVIAQIWDWLPMAYLSIWNVFDSRILCLLGHCFTSWQVVPIGYIVLSILLAVLEKCIYKRYQVSGR